MTIAGKLVGSVALVAMLANGGVSAESIHIFRHSPGHTSCEIPVLRRAD